MSFQLARPDLLTLQVYNLRGQLVQQLDLGLAPAGTHEHTLDLSAFASGTYLVRLSGEHQGTSIRKITLVK